MEIKCTIHVMCLNHLETTSCPQSMEEWSSVKLVPGAKKVGDCRYSSLGGQCSLPEQIADSLTVPYKRFSFLRMGVSLL